MALDDLAGWRWLLLDAVQPTALGQLELADRAAAARVRADWERMWVREAWRRRRA